MNKITVTILVIFSLLVGYLLGSSKLGINFVKHDDTNEISNTEGNTKSKVEKEHILINGKDCEIDQNYENPYKKGERIIASQSCRNSASMYSLFLTQGDGNYIELLTDRERYEYTALNVFKIQDNDIFTFLDQDNIIYTTADGEGGPCGGGSRYYYNKLNLRSGNVDILATGSAGYSCHDMSVEIDGYGNLTEKDVCYDSREDFNFGDINLVFTAICDGKFKNGFRNLSVKFNDKEIVSEKVPDTLDQPFKFMGIMNTIFIEKGELKDVGFQANSKGYSLNAITGNLIQTY